MLFVVLCCFPRLAGASELQGDLKARDASSYMSARDVVGLWARSHGPPVGLSDHRGSWAVPWPRDVQPCLMQAWPGKSSPLYIFDLE